MQQQYKLIVKLADDGTTAYWALFKQAVLVASGDPRAQYSVSGIMGAVVNDMGYQREPLSPASLDVPV